MTRCRIAAITAATLLAGAPAAIAAIPHDGAATPLTVVATAAPIDPCPTDAFPAFVCHRMMAGMDNERHTLWTSER
ncbi:MAG: hypothetical protein U0Y82_11125 [Thermoleophilia bacterium]